MLKKNLLILFMLSLFSWSLAAQCPGFTIVLNTQADVDNFAANYPNCTDILQNFRIGEIGSPTTITDLSPLSVITSVAGELGIEANPMLTSLDGLENLISVDNLFIRDNGVLNDLTALSSLATIQTFLYIQNNTVLTSLEGLNNVDPVALNNVQITDNPVLSTCEIESICGFIGNGSIVVASNNAVGCNSNMEVEEACNPALPCPIGDVFLFDQEQVDSFLILYPTCTTIDGNLIIGNEFGASDVNDLSALSGITTIYGGCYFYNTQLTNFAGVGNVSTINGECVISGNSQITNLNGLGAPPGFTITNLTITDNALLTEITAFSMLTSISGDLTISNNGSLTSFNGLQNLTTIGGGCYYYNNTSLTSIELISLTSVGDALEIVGNTSLTDCAIAGVCDAIAGSVTVVISGNGTGCGSIAEVEAACGGDVCPMGDLVLATQADVDNFVITYPDCTEVDGNLIIGIDGGSSDITDISGLSGITTVYGGCYFYNTQLTSFNGVGSITTVNGECVIVGNNLITNLNGLGAPPGFTITNLIITDNALLTEITAFSMLTTISGDLRIERNGSLTSFNGLQNLTTIGGGCYYYNNTSLTSIELISLTSVGGALEIVDNTSLSNCATASICDAVGSGGSIVISGNAVGCASLAEVQMACDLLGGGCPTGNIQFLSQADVDDFVAMYPTCTEIQGSLLIGPLNTHQTGETTDINDITGLSNITTVGGNLSIEGSPLLTSLQGLNAITSIGANLVVRTMTGLTDIDPLSNLTTMNGFLAIDGNTTLTSITGMGGIDITGITDLFIENNPSLSVCAISNVCAYLESPTLGVTSIFGNAAGCNSVMEVEAECSLVGGGCPPAGNVELLNQADVDAFVMMYPTCTEIQGGLYIGPRSSHNTGETSDITDISGLINITTVQGSLGVEGSPMLNSLQGLNSITSIGSNFIIRNVTAITNLDALASLTSMSGFMVIDGNTTLTSIDGIVNISATGITDLFIENNPSLSVCAISNVCAYLESPTLGVTSIFGNAAGCNSVMEVEAECEAISGPDCLEGDVILSNQAEVDFYVANFPNCTAIDGDLHIGASAGATNDITDITGLTGIVSVSGSLIITNTSLTTLTGLSTITTVGGNCLIRANTNLTSLQALSSITSVNGFLRIEDNTSLTTLMGAGSSNATGLTLLVITGNTQLVTCNIENVCNYLAVPENLATISNNAAGCNTRMEVEDACGAIIGGGDCPDNIEFMTQAEVDDFLVMYPNCTEIAGFVKIGCGNMPTNITDLTPLSNLVAIGGKLAIFLNPDLPSLDGLDNVVIVGGNIGLYRNNSLTDMSGLESLNTLGGDLNIHGNEGMIDLTGLEGITSIGGKVVIESNSTLSDLTGLGNVSSVGEFMGITMNSSLTSLDGLESLTSVGLSLNIESNTNLADIDALSSLTTVGFDLVLHGNGSLTDVDGLSSLSSVGRNLAFTSNATLSSLTGMSTLSSINGFLVIRNNDALSSLTGLENISAGNISRLYIVANSNLSDCAIANVCAYLAVPGSFATITKNTGDCKKRANVEAACNEGGIVGELTTTMQLGAESTSKTLGEGAIPSLSAGDISVGTTYGDEIKLYPNPTGNVLQVRNVVAQRVLVFNPQGQRVAQFNNPGTELDMSTLSAGVYYLNFLTAEGSITKRVVKVD